MTRRIYISGPMGGYPDLNEPAFRAAAAVIAWRGDEPIVPHDIPPHEHEGPCPQLYGDAAPGRHDSGCHLRADIAVMMTCDRVYRLSGWPSSQGARVESAVAELVGIRLMPVPLS